MSRPGFAALLVVACAVGCSSKQEEPVKPRKLSKLDVRITIDKQGRILPMFKLLDQKLKPIAVTGSYSISVARPGGAELCKLAGELAPADFTETETYQAKYRDASCPADPASSDLKIAITVTTPDKTIERTLDVPTRLVYEHLTPPPSGSAGSGSAGSSSAGSGSAGSGSAGSGSAGSGSAGSGSAQIPAEAPAASATQ